jgi:hypothetical protein
MDVRHRDNTRSHLVDQIVKAILGHNEYSDVSEIISMVPRIGKRLRTTVARNEDNVCSGIPSPSI